MTRVRIFLAVLLVIIIGATGCASRSGLRSFNGELLLFEDKEPGKKNSITRVLITDRFIRIDENFNATTESDSSAYTLYDRLFKKLYFVNRTGLFTTTYNLGEIKQRASKKLDWKIESEKSQASIRTEESLETKATFYKLSLNDNLCYNIVALSPASSSAHDALRAFRVAWASYLYTYKSDSPEFRNECYRAIHVDDPEKIFTLGFPTREWTPNGKQRFLVDFRTRVQFPSKLFKTGWW